MPRSVIRATHGGSKGGSIDVRGTVLVRTASVRLEYQPPVTRVVERSAVLRPAEARFVVGRPVYGVARHTVKLGSGGTAWRPLH